MSVKYSIIIPTAFDFLEKHLRTCIESIIEYTDLSNVEVIVVSNGSTDGTDDYIRSLGEPFKLITFPEALGYAKSVNAGIRASSGEYIIFCNNDSKLLPQPKNQWLDWLVEPFTKDPMTGVSGPLALHHECDREFIVFFLAMTTSKLAKQLMLDEGYGMGYGEDVAFCCEAEALGYRNYTVPFQKPRMTREPGRPWTGPFPLQHDGGATVNTVLGFDALVLKNIGILMSKYMPKKKKKVMAFIPTKNRYDSLALCLHSIALQTTPPDALVIFDDGEHKDLRNDHTYKMLFALLDTKKISWKVIFGDGKGQHHGHQWAAKQDYDFIFRCDDDHVLEPDVLERLLKIMEDPAVGAAAGSVFIPGDTRPNGSGKLLDIFHMPHIQWAPNQGVHEVEHLYSSFIYRPNIVNYETSLSPVGHREETFFSNRLFNAGYKLIVDTSIKTYHYKSPTGGIRSENQYHKYFFDADEKVFLKYLEEQGIGVVSLNSGLGDHYMFLNIVPDLQKKFKHLIIGCCYLSVFDGISNITLVPVSATDSLNDFNIYKHAIDVNLKTSMIDAYRSLYGI